MNIFDIYLEKINLVVQKLKEDKVIEVPDKLTGLNVDIPSSKFNCDISSNVAMLLSKPNNKSPIEIGKIIAETLKKEDDNINEIDVVKPGFINIKFKNTFWSNFLSNVINNQKNF